MISNLFKFLKNSSIPLTGIFLFLLNTLTFAQVFPSDQWLESNDFVRVDTLNGVLSEFPYSGENNFLKQNIYEGYRKMWLHKEAAEKLKLAIRYLKLDCAKCSLILFDGLRPRKAQVKMRHVAIEMHKGIYVSRAWPGSVHNFGMAVDLSMTDSLGNPLDMGTEFDHLGHLAQPVLQDSLVAEGALTHAQILNRNRLRRIMVLAGWIQLEIEWWHFNARLSQEVRRHFSIVE